MAHEKVNKKGVLWIGWGMIFLIFSALATSEDPVGWHWYNEPQANEESQNKGREERLLEHFNQLTATEKVEILQKATKNLLNKAILSGQVSDITAYKKAQDFWVNRSTLFTLGWEKMLLQHPALNYALIHPPENTLAPLLSQAQRAREKEAVLTLAQSHGLLYFYRGKNKADDFFSHLIARYAKQYHFALIPITVDGVLSPAFPNSQPKEGLEKATALGIHYFPALVLVNPSTRQHELISYGFQSESALSKRLLKIANNGQPDF